MTAEQIREIEISICELEKVKHFYYRSLDHRIKEFGIVSIPGEGDLYLPKSQLRQLYRYIDLKINDTRRMRSVDRDQAINEAIQRSDTVIKISIVGDKIIRIVSNDFQAIPHKTVLSAIEKALSGRYHKRNINYEHGLYGEWIINPFTEHIRKVGDIVEFKIWVYNHNTGDQSLRLGTGFTVLQCQNGATAWKNAFRFTMIHKGDLDLLEQKLNDAIHNLIYDHIPQISEQIELAPRRPYKFSKIEPYLDRFPIWIRTAVKDRLKKADNLWDVSNAFSYVATHAPCTWRQRRELENIAVEVLI